MDAIPYIDVTPPYFALRDIPILPSPPGKSYEGIGCSFSREQPAGLQITHFDAAEIGRHLAILGSLVADRTNPTKKKHYYLALFTQLHMNDIRTAHLTLRGSAFIAEPTDWAKRRVTAHMVATTLTGEQYARLEARYAILTQERLLQVTRCPDPDRILGNTWCLSEPSPYGQPIVLRDVRNSDSPEEGASATISLCDTSRMAGHFDLRPMAPIAILASNTLALSGIVVGGPFLCEYIVVRCKRLVVACEMLVVKLRRVIPGERSELPGATHNISLIDEQGKHVGSMLARIVCYSKQVSHL